MISKTKIIPRYAETDKMGVIHHSVYPIWFEVGRVNWCHDLGLPFDVVEEKGIYHALVKLDVEYKAPTFFGDELTLITKIKSYTKVRLVFEYEIYNQDGLLTTTGSTTIAWLDKSLKLMNLYKLHPDIYDMIEKFYNDQCSTLN